MQWTYTTLQGDTWDVLAKDIYGSEKLAHILQNANPQYLPLLYFPANLELVVPDLPILPQSTVIPPWER